MTEVELPGSAGPESLRLRERPVPRPSPGKALVPTEATGVPPSEWRVRRHGRRCDRPFPFEPGYDLVGVVVVLGDDGGVAGPPTTTAPPEPVRAGPDTDPARGTAVALVGTVEAVAVCDGQFTPVLRCTEFPRAVALEFTERMQKQALDNLCRRVEVGGRLYPVDAHRYRLEVHRLHAVRPSDGAERR